MTILFVQNINRLLCGTEEHLAVSLTEKVQINTNELKEYAHLLYAGQRILLSGYVFTARDAAHMRIFALLEQKKSLPFNIDGSVIYYAGPTPAPDHLCIGSCGPTTSSRMDVYAPQMLNMGLAAMIGKGERNSEVKEAIKKNGAVYLCALGGAGALACKCIKSCEVIDFEDLGCESIKRLYLKDFPLFVANDCKGGDIFEKGRHEWARNF
jgi:fumarate hydratase subunit beta